MKVQLDKFIGAFEWPTRERCFSAPMNSDVFAVIDHVFELVWVRIFLLWLFKKKFSRMLEIALVTVD
jgi:hypothetical protein